MTILAVFLAAAGVVIAARLFDVDEEEHDTETD